MFAFLVYARITAAIVLMVRVIIIIFISISNSLNRPISKISKQITVIRILHIAGFDVIPKRLAASPAVTMVTAVCMVNIVARLSTK